MVVSLNSRLESNKEEKMRTMVVRGRRVHPVLQKKPNDALRAHECSVVHSHGSPVVPCSDPSAVLEEEERHL